MRRTKRRWVTLSLGTLLSGVLFMACESSTEQPGNAPQAGAGGEAGRTVGRSEAGAAGSGAGNGGCAGTPPNCFGSDAEACCYNDPYPSTCVNGSWRCTFGNADLPPPGCRRFCKPLACGPNNCIGAACRISWVKLPPASGGAGGSAGDSSGGAASASTGNGGDGDASAGDGGMSQGGAAGAGGATEAPRYDCFDTGDCHDCACLAVPGCTCSQEGAALTLTCGR